MKLKKLEQGNIEHLLAVASLLNERLQTTPGNAQHTTIDTELTWHLRNELCQAVVGGHLPTEHVIMWASRILKEASRRKWHLAP